MGRVYKKKGKYHIEYRDAQGIRRRKKVGGSKQVANELLTDAEDRANRGAIGRFEQSSISFGDMAEQWFKSLRPDLKPRTLLKWRGVLDKHLKPAFRGMLRAVTTDAIEMYIKEQSDGGLAPATINGILAVLRLVMTRSVEKKLVTRSPFRDERGEPVKSLKPLREPDERVRYLTDVEQERLFAEIERDPYLNAFVLVALNTAMRLREVHSLTRAAIDWENRKVVLTEAVVPSGTKNHRARVVWLNPVAISALEGLPTRLDGKFWPCSPDAMSMRFTRASRRAGLNDFHLHDCKHHCMTMHAANGIAGKPLSALGGHSRSSTTDKYVAVVDTHLRDAVDRLQIGAAPSAAKA